tara:strand:- start:207 stop:419 length:213 start_codon:yes stop_codon:yes gene_type:complete
MKVIKDLRILNAIGKRYHLEFDSKFKYYTGDAYKNSVGEYLPLRFEYKDKIYNLTYFDGCFNPFLTQTKH